MATDLRRVPLAHTVATKGEVYVTGRATAGSASDLMVGSNLDLPVLHALHVLKPMPRLPSQGVS